MTQHALILRALKAWLSPLDALHKAGTMKLATRVGELRRAGHIIDDKWVEQGGGKRFKCYRLSKSPVCYFTAQGDADRAGLGK